MGLRKLKIDDEFRHLIRPLRQREYAQLEQNILSDGCRDPIVVWNGVIVDGHNRYEICMRHGVPFATKEMEFECREAAIAWICANQLGRRNITEETRKFLIGMQYENEKVVTKIRNRLGKNQHSIDTSDMSEAEEDRACRHWTARRIAEENNVSAATVQKYAFYTRALEEIGRKEPKLVPKILSGQYKIAHKLRPLIRCLPFIMHSVFYKELHTTKQFRNRIRSLICRLFRLLYCFLLCPLFSNI